MSRFARLLLPAALAFAFGIGIGSPVRAADLTLIAPLIPPHFDTDGAGRIGDVIRAVLEHCGHQVTFEMVPFGRHWKDYEDHARYDGLATAEADQVFTGFSTRAFIHLQDGATVSARGELAAIASVNALRAKHVIAFPNADSILGIEAAVPTFASFRMRANRLAQLRPLFAGRVDAVLADGLITAHFTRTLLEDAARGAEPGIDPRITVVFRKIFAPGPQRLYFRRQSHATDFDRCYQALLGRGDVRRITRAYVDVHREVLGDQYPDF